MVDDCERYLPFIQHKRADKRKEGAVHGDSRLHATRGDLCDKVLSEVCRDEEDLRAVRVREREQRDLISGCYAHTRQYGVLEFERKG
jgi:hypothetical protein